MKLKEFLNCENLIKFWTKNFKKILNFENMMNFRSLEI